MDVYIVDSNLIFSAVLNIKSGIGQFILKSSNNNVSLYAPKYLQTEIERHFDKIVQRSKLEAEEVRLLINKIYKYITFIKGYSINYQTMRVHIYACVRAFEKKMLPFGNEI